MYIVLVHLGNNFFDYINDCIRQIRKFNDSEIYVIINTEHHSKIENFESIKLISPNKITKSENHILFDKNNNLDKTFRGGFWKYTTERFLYIEDLMIEYGLTNVFHLENDNLIFFEIKELLDVFEKNYTISTVFDNDNRSIPGFVYIKNEKSISDFNKFVNEHNNINDMELFSMYNNKVGHKLNLPVLPNHYDLDLVSMTGNRTKNPKQFFNNFEKFDSIFDGAAIGQFLGGIDIRNSNNHSQNVGFINESSLFSMKNFEILFIVDSKNRKIPVINYKNKKHRINNLHIHSKNLKQFLS